MRLLITGSDESWSKKNCPVHGLTAFQGSACRKCINEKLKPPKRNCEACGDLFRPTGSKQTFRRKIHEWTCKVCGGSYYSRFEKRSCSYGCSLKTANRSKSTYQTGTCEKHGEGKFYGRCLSCILKNKSFDRVCEICGDTFKATHGRQKICLKERDWVCAFCGETYQSRKEKNYCSAPKARFRRENEEPV